MNVYMYIYVYTYIHIYVYTYMYIFWLKHKLNYEEWHAHVHRGFPGKLESSSPSRDNVSREIGRTSTLLCSRASKTSKLPHISISMNDVSRCVRVSTRTRDIHIRSYVSVKQVHS